jgi:flagellar hook-associated protein FlgK
LKYQIKIDEDLFNKYYELTDKYYELVDELVDKYDELVDKLSNRIGVVEHNTKDNKQTIEYISNMSNEIIKALSERISFLENMSTGDTDGDEVLTKSSKYEWQYCNDPNREQPIVGESYIIVGRVKGANVTEVESENGNYGENKKFYKSDGTPFEKVYAYIRIPKASDIQERLFTLINQDPLAL